MEEVRCDSVNEQMMVTVMDTLKEVTTITLVLRQTQEPTAPDDTVRMTTVTDRTRSHDRLMSEVRSKMEEVIIRTDTVYIQKDSLQFTVYGLQNPERLPVSSKQSTVSQILKWIFWILLILTVLIIVVRIFVFRR